MNITVYSTTNCGICHSLMQWLNKNGQSYDNVVIDTVPDGIATLLEISDGAIGTPFTVIETGTETVKIAGFDQARFKSVLAL